MSAWREARLVRTGEWSRVYGDVVAAGPADAEDVVRAALLAAAPDVALTAESGAQLWLDRTLSFPVQLAVPHGRRFPETAQVRFHQLREWIPPVRYRDLPVHPPAKVAAAVAAGTAREADRRALVTALVQRGLTTAGEVAAAAGRTPRRVRGQVRRLVEEVLAGAHSGPEAALWRHIVEARLPVPVLNHPLRGGARSLDGYLAQLDAGYEVQSTTHHAGTWREDTRRLSEIAGQRRDRAAADHGGGHRATPRLGAAGSGGVLAQPGCRAPSPVPALRGTAAVAPGWWAATMIRRTRT